MAKHERRDIALNSATMAFVTKVVEANMPSQLALLDYYQTAPTWLTLMFVPNSRQTNGWTPALALAAGDYKNPVVAAMVEASDGDLRVVVLFEGKLSSAYDLIRIKEEETVS